MKNPTPVGAFPAPRQAAHTPEPWDKPEISSGDSGGWKQHSQRIEIWAGEKLIAYYPTDFCEYGTDKENIANAKRIVSCVNALRGVSNPAAVKQLIEAAIVAVREYRLVKQISTNGFLDLVAALAALYTPVTKLQDLGER